MSKNSWSPLSGENLTTTEIIANDEVIIEPKALDQLRAVAGLEYNLRKLGVSDGHIEKIVATPDLHVGSPFPVGVAIKAHGLVIPGAVGNDIGCGMRLAVFDITQDDLEGKYSRLEESLRQIYFGGKRNVPLSPRQRNALLREGMMGLIDTWSDNASEGIWQHTSAFELEKQLDRCHESGSLIADSTFSGHDKWVQSSGLKRGHDSQIASIGGGNHFVELQSVEQLHDHFAASQYGLKQNQLAVMIHTGSVSLGQGVGSYYKDLARRKIIETAPHARRLIPEHLFPLLDEQSQGAYLDHMSSAANFATINRLTLSLLFKTALEQALGKEVEMKLAWDSPHNLTWQKGNEFIHRKGATPAHGPSPVFNYAGEPVLLPGSMGDNSWVLSGMGLDRALQSASHGAGRALSRGRASHLEGEQFDGIRVVGPVDLNDLIHQGRADIAKEIAKRFKEESPRAYKPVLPALESLESAQVANRVAKMQPLLTVKDL